MRRYVVIRIPDGYRLKTIFTERDAAERHAESMSLLTGREYVVVNYIQSPTGQPGPTAYM